MSKTAVIIGSGIAGIASSIRLAHKGYQVSLYEAAAQAGGKLNELRLDGYRFDAGPSLFTMPQYVDELFELCGISASDHFSYQKADTICNYFWDDGVRLRAFAENEAFATEVAEQLNESKEVVLNYLQKSAKNYNILSPLFIEKSLHQLSTWISPEAFKGYKNLAKLGLFNTLHQENKKSFKSDKLIQLFDRYATYNGSDPYQTPGTMSIIPHLEYNLGAYFPQGGMYNITKSLISLAEKMGVSVHLNTKVDEIVVKDKKAVGVRINSQKDFLPFDLVVSNMDITPTYRKLLPHEKAPEKTLSQDRSGSGLIYYWGIKKEFKELGLHNIFFSNNYKEEFKHQFQHQDIYNDPTVYVNISSKYKHDDAPQGCENWFVLINAPASKNQDWAEITQRTKKNIIKKLDPILKTDLNKLIEVEEVLDPITIESKTSSAQGALYGTSSNGKFSAFLRHPNFSKRIHNLYFVGGSVHPGGGIPLALSSAKIMASML